VKWDSVRFSLWIEYYSVCSVRMGRVSRAGSICELYIGCREVVEWEERQGLF
jgi:hypothetical protein